jgi:hypothetical protein
MEDFGPEDLEAVMKILDAVILKRRVESTLGVEQRRATDSAR